MHNYDYDGSWADAYTDHLLYGDNIYLSLYRKGIKKLASESSKTVFATGFLMWAKIVGDSALQPNYERTGREWSLDFYPDDTSFLKEHKLLDRLKENDEGDYIRIKKSEFDREGKKNKPFRIYTADDEAWDEETLIGNKSRVDMKLSIVNWGAGKKKSIYATAIRVTEHVPFKSNEFAGMDNKTAVKDDSVAEKPKRSASKPKEQTILEELDDDLPF